MRTAAPACNLKSFEINHSNVKERFATFLFVADVVYYTTFRFSSQEAFEKKNGRVRVNRTPVFGFGDQYNATI